MIEKIAIRLLSLKSQSSCELRKKLTRKGFSTQEIDPVLEKYTRLGYLNDADLTKRRSEAYKKKGYGPHWITGKLRQQGLRPPPYPLEEQKANIAKLLGTAAFLKKNSSQQLSALQRRGFDLQAILDTIQIEY